MPKILSGEEIDEIELQAKTHVYYESVPVGPLSDMFYSLRKAREVLKTLIEYEAGDEIPDQLIVAAKKALGEKL